MNREILKQNFEAHDFKTSFFDTKEEAVKYLTGAAAGKDIAIGGCMTISNMKLVHELKEAGCRILAQTWRKGDMELLKEEMTAEVFMCSANGVSETGELVNIDGVGNRVIGTIFGHKKVYIIVGKNKICPTLAQAYDRAKNVAAPTNCKALGKTTPCAQSGKCENCTGPDRSCRVTVILERATRNTETEVVFIDEELGY